MNTINTLNTMLSTTNAMDALKQTGDNFFADTTVILGVALLAAIVFAGFKLVIGSKETKRSTKEDLPNIALGAIMVAGAAAFAAWLLGNIAF